MVDRATQGEIDWAHGYDAYRRLASTPEELAKLLQPARNSYCAHGRIPEWCGVDFLRGWAFFLVRADRHSGGGTLEEEWRAVLAAVASHPDATADERPPQGER